MLANMFQPSRSAKISPMPYMLTPDSTSVDTANVIALIKRVGSL